MKEEIDIGIMDVVRKNHIRIVFPSGNSLRATCPFCGGKSTLSITPSKNMYHCFLCEASGNPATLEYELNPIEYSGNDRYVKFLKNMSEFLGTGISDGPQISPSIEYAMLKPEEANEKASDEQCSQVYYAMLKLLDLKDEHKNDLLRRGLSEEQIRKFWFRSSPTDAQKYSIPRKLLEQGYCLSGVPPFYKEGNKWIMKTPAESYLCPVFDGHKNLILGFQPRLDTPIDGNKYTWLSSVGKPEGCSSGTIASILPGEYDKAIVIVEGTLKAIIVYVMLNRKITVVSQPGVNSIACLDPVLAEYEGKYAFECYDMDKYPTRIIKNPRTEEEKREVRKLNTIQKAMKKLEDKCVEYDVNVHHMTWNFKNGLWNGQGKGLDDFLFDYNNRDLFANYLISKADRFLKMKKTLSE